MHKQPEGIYIDVCRQSIASAQRRAELGGTEAFAFLGAADALSDAAARGEVSTDEVERTLTLVLECLVKIV